MINQTEQPNQFFGWQIKSERLDKEKALKCLKTKNEAAINNCVHDCIQRLKEAGSTITADELVPNLSIYNFSDGRALGAVMIRLRKLGHIEPTTEYRESVRLGSHGVPRRIYRVSY